MSPSPVKGNQWKRVKAPTKVKELSWTIHCKQILLFTTDQSQNRKFWWKAKTGKSQLVL